MNLVLKKVSKILNLLRCKYVWVPIVVFTIFYCVNFWLTIIHSDVLYGGPGDHIAGIIWLYDRYSATPWWGYTNLAAYPWGDTLWSPLFITGQIGYILFWLCSKAMHGSVGGYNLFTFIAFTLSYVVAYSFIYIRFIKRPLVATLFSIAIVFSPMAFYLDAVGHTSYLFMPAYMIGVIWLILCMLERKSALVVSILLGLLGGATLIFDPYYVLFIPLAAVLFLAPLVKMGYYRQFGLTFRDVCHRALIVAGASLFVIVPVLLYVKLNIFNVQTELANTRLVGLHDAYIYSAQLVDYILPGVSNPFVPSVISHIKQATMHGNNPTFTLYLGWILISASTGVVIWWMRHKPAKKHLQTRMIGVSFLVVAVGAFLFSLPPTINVLGLTIYMPTWLIASITPTWRVFARLYFVVQPALLFVVIAWLVEYTHTKRFIKKQRAGWYVILALVVVLLLEYTPRNPFDESKFWSFSHSLPTVYRDIKESSGKVLAEYPMREQPYYNGSLYLAGQHVHKKATINAYMPTSTSAFTRTALLDLANPQTIPALRYLKTDTLLVWNTSYQSWSPKDGDGLRLQKTEPYFSQFGNSILKLYSISDDGHRRRYIASIQSNFKPSEDRTLWHVRIPLQSGISLNIVDLCKETHMSDCSDEGKILEFRGVVVNTTKKPVTVRLRSIIDSSVRDITLSPGDNHIDLTVSASRYIFEFDKSLDGTIYVYNQEIVQ